MTDRTNERPTEFTPVTHTVEGIWVGHRDRIEKKLKTMNRRLAKLGAPAASVEYGPEVVRIENRIPDGLALYGEFDAETGETDTSYAEAIGAVARIPEFEFVTITGVSAKYNGWTPIASLDHTFHTADGNDEAYVSMFPFAVENEIELTPELRRVGATCDHCRKSRRRNTTVLFLSDDGEWLNVGTSCFRDFVGVTPATVLWLVESIASFADDDEFATPAEAYEPDLTFVLRIASALTDTFGFVRSREPGATKDAIMTVYTGRPSRAAREITEAAGWDAAWAASADKAEAIKTWVLDKADNGNYSDYIANAALTIRANRAAARSLGLLASLPFAYARAMGELAEREAKRAARPDSVDEHVGDIGDKMILRPVTIVKAIKVDTMYGTSVRVTGIDADGHKVTTFGSGDSLFGVDVDDVVEWRGTVKAHNSSDDYGVETEFNRVKMLDLPSDVDFTRVARKGDRVKVNVTGNAHELRFPSHVPDGWVFDSDTDTLWATIEKVGKRDDRFTYTTNAPIGFFAGADIEVLDDDAEFPAWRMTDIDVKRELRWHGLSRRMDDEDRDVERRFRVRMITKWAEERGVDVTDELIEETIGRYEALTAEENIPA